MEGCHSSYSVKKREKREENEKSNKGLRPNMMPSFGLVRHSPPVWVQNEEIVGYIR